MHEKFTFIPEIEIDNTQVLKEVAVKGQSSILNYSYTFSDIYPVIPNTTSMRAYKKIKDEFDKINIILSQKLKLRTRFAMPSTTNNAQALYILSVLFDPTFYGTDRLWNKINFSNAYNPQTNFFSLDISRPFPLKLASPEKILHTLFWIDTNIKVMVENIAETYKIPTSDISQIVKSAFKIYSYLVKQNDYYLARSINFNYSMFLQDRILNLIFGDAIYLSANSLIEKGKLSNRIALDLLKNLGEMSYRQLCTLSVFMGVIWTAKKDIQESFLSHPDKILSSVETQLNAMKENWCIDHIDRFIVDMGRDITMNISVILDDNGESVFDIALFQHLLIDNPKLRITFIVNRYPISNNIALDTFRSLIEDNYFENLREFFIDGHAMLCIEEQLFRSFELMYLTPQTRHTIEQSQFAYIKGINFFETLQIFDIIRYHCFTVHGHTSKILTGCPENKGIFVKLNPNQSGYSYYSHNNIETLLDKIEDLN